MDGGYCIMVIHDISPADALRRFGADDDQISVSTWVESAIDQLRGRRRLPRRRRVRARRTLLVEEGGREGVERPDLSRGTVAASSCCSIDSNQTFLVSEDCETLATFDGNYRSDAEGADISVLEEPLFEMGIDDPDEFDEGEDNFLDDLELLCRITGIRPTVPNVTEPAHVAILPRQFSPVTQL